MGHKLPKEIDITEAVMKSILPQAAALAALAFTTICPAEPFPGATGVQPFEIRDAGSFFFANILGLRIAANRDGVGYSVGKPLRNRNIPRAGGPYNLAFRGNAPSDPATGLGVASTFLDIPSIPGADPSDSSIHDFQVSPDGSTIYFLFSVTDRIPRSSDNPGTSIVRLFLADRPATSTREDFNYLELQRFSSTSGDTGISAELSFLNYTRPIVAYHIDSFDDIIIAIPLGGNNIFAFSPLETGDSNGRFDLAATDSGNIYLAYIRAVDSSIALYSFLGAVDGSESIDFLGQSPRIFNNNLSSIFVSSDTSGEPAIAYVDQNNDTNIGLTNENGDIQIETLPTSVGSRSTILQGFSIDGNNRRHLLVNTTVPRDTNLGFIPCFTYYRDDIASDGVTRTPFYAFSVEQIASSTNLVVSRAGFPRFGISLDRASTARLFEGFAPTGN